MKALTKKQTKRYLKFFSVLILTFTLTPRLAEAGSFSKKPKEQSSKPAPTKPAEPKPSEPVEPEPTEPESPASEGSITKGNVDVINDLATPVGTYVDGIKGLKALTTRRASPSHSVDTCQTELAGHTRFADRLSYFVNSMTEDQRPQIGYISSYYGISSNVANHAPVSLIRHPVCGVSSSTLKATLGSSRVPSAATIQKANEFANRSNELRALALKGDRRAELDFNRLWTQFFGCLAYIESLPSADSSKSNRVASKYAPSGYRKPAGVEFYEDPTQDAASRLNIGMFQFTPTASGNVQACIQSWNQRYPTCRIATNASQAEMIRVVGSSLQTFNAFCGAHKVLQSFAVQVNTRESSRTHPWNSTNGGLRAADNRCVSLHFTSGKTYNHFGPLMNSTGSNLSSLLTCALR